MNTIRAVLFDFDGTLADTMEPIKQSFRGAVSDLGIPLPFYKDYDARMASAMEEIFASLPGMDAARVSEAIRLYQKRYEKQSPSLAAPFPGVTEALGALWSAGVKMAIATNEIRKNLDNLVRSFGIGSYFTGAMCSDEVSIPKPDPEMALKLLRLLDVRPDEAIMVGDSALDMEMGASAGCYTCAVTYGSHSEKALAALAPHWIIRDIRELPDILEIPGRGASRLISGF